MVQMTMQVPEELAKRIQPIQVWLLRLNDEDHVIERRRLLDAGMYG